MSQPPPVASFSFFYASEQGYHLRAHDNRVRALLVATRTEDPCNEIYVAREHCYPIQSATCRQLLAGMGERGSVLVVTAVEGQKELVETEEVRRLVEELGVVVVVVEGRRMWCSPWEKIIGTYFPSPANRFDSKIFVSGTDDGVLSELSDTSDIEGQTV